MKSALEMDTYAATLHVTLTAVAILTERAGVALELHLAGMAGNDEMCASNGCRSKVYSGG